MSPHRARYLLFLIFCIALTAGGIWYLIPGGPAPGVISAPNADMQSASSDISLPLNIPGQLPFGSEEHLQIESMERNDPDLFRRNIEDMLALSVREKIPGVQLSEKEFRGLAEDIRIMHETFAGLRETRRTPENAADIKVLAGRLEESSRRIQGVTGMSAAEFLNRLTTEGIDNDKPEEGDVVLEYLDPPDR